MHFYDWVCIYIIENNLLSFKGVSGESKEVYPRIRCWVHLFSLWRPLCGPVRPLCGLSLLWTKDSWGADCRSGYFGTSVYKLNVWKKLATKLILLFFEYANGVDQNSFKTTLLPLNIAYNDQCRFFLGCSFSTHCCIITV